MAGNPPYPFFIVVGSPLPLTPYPSYTFEITSRILHNIRVLFRMQVTQGSFYITTTSPRNRLLGYRVINSDPGLDTPGICLTPSRAESLYPLDATIGIRKRVPIRKFTALHRIPGTISGAVYFGVVLVTKPGNSEEY